MPKLVYDVELGGSCKGEPMPLADLYVCPLCERPLEATGIVLVRLGKPLTGRKARRKLKRDGLRPPRIRIEARRRLECGHHVAIEKRPVFRNWYSPGAKEQADAKRKAS